MQEQHMEGETLNKVPLVQDRSAQDKPASSSMPQRAEEGGSAFSPSAQQFSWRSTEQLPVFPIQAMGPTKIWGTTTLELQKERQTKTKAKNYYHPVW